MAYGSMLVGLLTAALAVTQPQRWPDGPISPTIDGPINRTEWARAGRYLALDEAPAGVEGLLFGWSSNALFLAVQHRPELPAPALRLQRQAADGALTTVGRLFLAPDGRARLEPAARAMGLRGARGRGSTEYAIPWAVLGLSPGDTLLLQAEGAAGVFPAAPLRLVRP